MRNMAALSTTVPGLLPLAWLVGCGGADGDRVRVPNEGTDGATEAAPHEVAATEQAPITAPATRTACAISAKLVPSEPDAGDQAMPSTHVFTLLVDWAGNTATTGSGGTATRVPLVQQAGIWSTQGVLTLSLGLARSFTPEGTGADGLPLVRYRQMAIRPTADGCTGHATGDYLWNVMDMLHATAFEAELSGVADQTGPALSPLPAATTAVHPLDLEGIAASELLPTGASGRWIAVDGAAVAMSPLPAGAAVGVSGFLCGDFALAFATSYRLEILPAAIDLEGHPAAQLPSLTTMSGPGFLAQDGFESTVAALLGGKVTVVTTTSGAVPAGQKAVRFGPSSLGLDGDWSCEDRFTARLAVAAGAKAVKLSVLPYRSVKSSSTPPFQGWLRLAVPNGTVADFGHYWIPSGGTPLPSPWTGPPPGSDQWSYGALAELELALPSGADNEIIFDLYRPCTEPLLYNGGLVIDDLRVE